MVDIDEFVLVNRHFENASKAEMQRLLSSSLLAGIRIMPEYENRACITMPRVRFGNYLDPKAMQKTCSPPGFNDMDFLTFRWRWRALLDSRKVSGTCALVMPFDASDEFAHWWALQGQPKSKKHNRCFQNRRKQLFSTQHRCTSPRP